MWIYIVAAVLLYLILRELIRLPTIGKYGDRYVFITGCDTGFGNRLAKRLDTMGFNVFAACFTEKGEEELKKVSSARLKTLFLDVSKPESIQKARENVEKQLPAHKGLWAIVNNAGVAGKIGFVEWLVRKDYEDCNAINLYGIIDVTRMFLPLVRKAQGRIVITSSMVGRIAASPSPYVVAKYGVEGFGDCLRRELYYQGVSVHLVEPGHFDTNLRKFDMKKGIDETFSRCSPEIQQYYGKKFVDESYDKGMKFLDKLVSPKLSLVVDCYTHAITAMFPRTRYLVGNDCKYFFRILWNLPDCITDWVLTRTASIPAGQKK